MPIYLDDRVAYVYWIHLPTHTDMMTQGYIGITSKTVEVRYKQHLAASTVGGDNRVINKAIRKYGDALIVTTLLVGTAEYCAEVEGLLRPAPGIGYNMIPGGAFNPLNARRGSTTSAEVRQKQSLAKLGKPLTASHRENLCIARASVPSWYNSVANKSVWLMAGDIFKVIQDQPEISRASLSRLLDVKSSQLKSIFNKIKSGWNPTIDPQWVKFHTETSI